ncbi:MAG: creatininase family protein [Candidatus Rokuibacteriota bacterium]|nr:MAG: creatininase family protein [Candidatus Rokubacteria bacterium]
MLARMTRLGDLTWPEARRCARDRRSVVLLPLGAVEQHGPHLPLAVDWLGAEELARRVAPHLERSGWRPVLAPSLPYGASTLAATWSGTVSLSVATTTRLIVEVVRGLAAHGFRRFVLTNYQADPDHLRAIAAARRTLTRGGRRQVLVAGFAPPDGRANPMLDPRVHALMRSPRPEREWHSGEVETAVMLAVAPALVRRAVARRLPPAWTDWAAALARGIRRFERMQPGGRGYFGWPAVARAETGRRVLTLRGRLIAAVLLEDLARWPPSRATPR